MFVRLSTDKAFARFFFLSSCAPTWVYVCSLPTLICYFNSSFPKCRSFISFHFKQFIEVFSFVSFPTDIRINLWYSIIIYSHHNYINTVRPITRYFPYGKLFPLPLLPQMLPLKIRAHRRLKCEPRIF